MQRIPGTTWAKEMDMVHPLNGNDNVSRADVTCPKGEHVAEVSQETEKILKRSFMSLKNAFALPLVAVM